MIGLAPISASMPVGVWTRDQSHFSGRAARTGSANNFGTNDSDGIFGFHAGAQWQWGAWVLGAEAALERVLQGVSEPDEHATCAPFATPNFAGQHKITNLFTVGPRLGYAWDRLMLFATGGYASANLKGTYCSTVTGLATDRAI